MASSTKCTDCGMSYHNDTCSKSARKRSKGTFDYCCKNSNPNSSTNNYQQVDLDPTLKPLWSLIESKLNSSLATIDDRFRDVEATLENKIDLLVKYTSALEDKSDAMEDRINSMEANIQALSFTTVSDVKDMIQRQKNIILYEFEDSVNAVSEDLIKVQNIFKNSPIQVPFNIDSIKTRRRGKKFIQGKHRLLKLTFQSIEHTSWVFHNKKSLYNGNLKVSGDLTKNQQAYFKSIKSELKNRIDKGEQNLYIAYHNRVPYIAKKSNSSNQ